MMKAAKSKKTTTIREAFYWRFPNVDDLVGGNVPNNNTIGSRGELIFSLQITKIHGNDALFRVVMMGEKWPTVDYVVELTNHPGSYFFVQVKSTSKKLNSKKNVPAAATRKKVIALLAYQVPTFVVAVDEGAQAAYLIRPKPKGYSSFGTKYPLSEAAVRLSLETEVAGYWASVQQGVGPYVSKFVL